MISFIEHAYAADGPTASPLGGADMSSIMNFLPLLFIFAIFYFLIIRPQQRKMDAQTKLVQALKKGDRVITTGGIVGTIQRTDDDQKVTILIAKDVEIQVLRNAVTSLYDEKSGKAETDKSSQDQKK